MAAHPGATMAAEPHMGVVHIDRTLGVCPRNAVPQRLLGAGRPPRPPDSPPPRVVRGNPGQCTGRSVTVTNGGMLTNPVDNAPRDFPYLWEESVIPVDYDVDRAYVERVLLEVADAYAVIDDADARQALA